MSPEYAMHGQFSVKSDVFSFGVMVLEIISGKKNSCTFESCRIDDLLSYVSIYQIDFYFSLYFNITKTTKMQINKEMKSIELMVFRLGTNGKVNHHLRCWIQ